MSSDGNDSTPNSKKRKLAKLEIDVDAANADFSATVKGKGAKTKAKTKKSAPSKWTPDESEALLKAAIKSSASLPGFEGAVPGRTAKQCYDKKTMYPWLIQKAREK